MSKPTTVTVEPGVLVQFAGLGIQIGADYNPDTTTRQPFVTINTEELDAKHTYGPDNGVPATVSAALGEAI